MIKKNLSAIIVAGAAVLALIFGLILPGAAYSVELGSATETGAANLIGLMFGSTTITITATAGTMTQTASMIYQGGMSIFGLISLIALIAGIALIIVSIFGKGKNLNLIGSICIAVAGILVFFLLTCGTDVTGVTIDGKTNSGSPVAFAEVYEEFKLGAGAIIYGILAILGGAFGIVNNFKKLI